MLCYNCGEEGHMVSYFALLLSARRKLTDSQETVLMRR
jgi:hypothetical protein